MKTSCRLYQGGAQKRAQVERGGVWPLLISKWKGPEHIHTRNLAFSTSDVQIPVDCALFWSCKLGIFSM